MRALLALLIANLRHRWRERRDRRALTGDVIREELGALQGWSLEFIRQQWRDWRARRTVVRLQGWSEVSPSSYQDDVRSRLIR